MHFLPLTPNLRPLHITPATTTSSTFPAIQTPPSPFLTLLPTPGIPWRHPSTNNTSGTAATTTTAGAAGAGAATASSAKKIEQQHQQHSNSNILALAVECSLQTATAAAVAARNAEKARISSNSAALRAPFRKLRRVLGFPLKGLVGAAGGGDA